MLRLFPSTSPMVRQHASVLSAKTSLPSIHPPWSFLIRQHGLEPKESVPVPVVLRTSPLFVELTNGDLCYFLLEVGYQLLGCVRCWRRSRFILETCHATGTT